MTAAATLAATRARLAAIWPGARDDTGDPHPTPEGRLPAFRVDLELGPGELVAMGSADYQVEGELTVALYAKAPRSVDPADALALAADQAATALIEGGATLGEACYDIRPAGLETEVAAAEGRVCRLALTMAVVLIGPDPGAAPSGLGLAG